MPKFCLSLTLIHRFWFFILIFLVQFPSGFLKEIEGDKSAHFLSHFKFSHMYSFRSQSLCPDMTNTYVIGARARLSNHLHQSEQMVTALELVCSDNIGTKVKGDVMILDKNIGEWSEDVECPNGQFATEIVFHLQSFQSFGLIAQDDKYQVKQHDENGRTILNVRSVVRSRFIAGITFNCTYGDHDAPPSKTKLSPHEKDGDSAFTIGNQTGYGLRIYCMQDRVISGIYIADEAVISYVDGERLVPIRLTIRCEQLFNPAGNCHPELNWERLKQESLHCGLNEKGKLRIQHLEEISKEFTCKLNHFMGPRLNPDIANLHRIQDSYQPINLNSEAGLLLIPKLLSPLFRRDWVDLNKLSSDDYNRVVKSNIFAYLRFQDNEISEVKFSNVQHLEKTKLGNNSVHHELAVFQLVAYCGVYKIYFPMFKTDFLNVIPQKIDGILREIILGGKITKLSDVFNETKVA